MRNPPAKQPTAASSEPVDAYATPPSAIEVARCPPGIIARPVARLIPNGPLPWGFRSVCCLLGWAVFQLVLNVAEDFGTILGSEFAFHAAQSDTDDIPVVQLAAEVITQLEPQVVHQVDVFRPQTRRMWSKIHEY